MGKQFSGTGGYEKFCGRESETFQQTANIPPPWGMEIQGTIKKPRGWEQEDAWKCPQICSKHFQPSEAPKESK